MSRVRKVRGPRRGAALFGHRVLCLVRSDDPDIEFEPVGAMAVDWNGAERSGASRRSAQAD